MRYISEGSLSHARDPIYEVRHVHLFNFFDRRETFGTQAREGKSAEQNLLYDLIANFYAIEMKDPKSTLSVHRCRFVDFVPSAVTALAFPPLPLHSSTSSTSRSDAGSSKKRRFGTLAVGRANGNIELYEWSGSDHDVQSSQAWVPWKVRSLAQNMALCLVLTLKILRLFRVRLAPKLTLWSSPFEIRNF